MIKTGESTPHSFVTFMKYSSECAVSGHVLCYTRVVRRREPVVAVQLLRGRLQGRRSVGGLFMPIAFDRSICRDLNETISREWLITNGLGGYAAGTVAGVLTRMQHGLLVASLQDATTPQLLLAKIDEEVVFDQRTYYLGTNEYRDGTLNPGGFVHLETFHLEEGFPVFTYRLGGIEGIMLEKRIWMAHGYNTTYIQYCVLRTEAIRSNPYNTHISGHGSAGWNNGDASGGAS